MGDVDAILNRSPSKLKMVECKQLLGCKDNEWSEIGAIVRSNLSLFVDLRFSYWKLPKSLNCRQHPGRTKNTILQQPLHLNEYRYLKHISPNLEKTIGIVTKS